ncbi:MAG: zf-HC2 domain-containing protein [Chloroflexi bacterium]|nr:zf-HC2 domain-containing protein [Chloroflexota bacterium]
MTLPFRRRHHDDDAWHDRARALFSAGFLGPLDADDQAWLDRHLEKCGECRADREAYDADHAMLRSLRDQAPVPPRDLWARIATELDRQSPAARARRGPLGLSLPPVSSRGLPYGPLAGALVALVVLVVALLPPGAPQVPGQSPGGSQITVGSQQPGVTPIPIAADRVAWVTSTGDGRYSLVFAAVDEVCTDQAQGCAPLAASSPAPLLLGAPPKAVVSSPLNDQVAVVGADGESAGSVVIVSVPTPTPSVSAAPTAAVPSATAVLPTESAAGSPGSSPTTIPSTGGHAIIHGVTVVGEVGYSDDGQWFAFSARPLGGSGGPDLYVWHVGDDQATQVTHDGATFFSGWFQNRIVASAIVIQSSVTPDASAAPGASAAVPSEPPVGTASPVSSPAAEPSAAAVREEHPYSFLLDPVTGVRANFAQPDVWLPVIDPTGRFVAYWSGTVQPANADAGTADSDPVGAWKPANGRLVLDGWSAPITVPEPSPDPLGPDTTGQPSAEAPSQAPSPETTEPADATDALGSPEPSEAVSAHGPAGTPMTLADAPVADFDLHFDPTGTRLAIWTADPDDPKIGPLWLVILDPVLGGPVPMAQPLQAPGVVATRGFSIQEGRLGWVTPTGQDGQPSSVHVLGWSGDEFGQVQTVPGGSLQIVR